MGKLFYLYCWLTNYIWTLKQNLHLTSIGHMKHRCHDFFRNLKTWASVIYIFRNIPKLQAILNDKWLKNERRDVHNSLSVKCLPEYRTATLHHIRAKMSEKRILQSMGSFIPIKEISRQLSNFELLHNLPYSLGAANWNFFDSKLEGLGWLTIVTKLAEIRKSLWCNFKALWKEDCSKALLNTKRYVIQMNG